MTSPTRTLLAALAAAAVLLPFSGATAVGPDPVSAKPEAYPKPQAGSWKFKDPFGDSEGSLKVTGGATPKVKGLTITVTQQDNGYMCPAPGAVLEVAGAFKLRKGPKWADDYFKEDFAWITAPKDKPYDDSTGNLLGMKPVPVSITIGAEKRNGLLAISFDKDKRSKPHELDLTMMLFAPGQTTTGEGYCIFGYDGGKPGK